MQYKYTVEIIDEYGDVEESWEYKTKGGISETYNIPLYIIDKIIKKSNTENYSTKRDAHIVYKDLMESIRIKINKPQFRS